MFLTARNRRKETELHLVQEGVSSTRAGPKQSEGALGCVLVLASVVPLLDGANNVKASKIPSRHLKTKHSQVPMYNMKSTLLGVLGAGRRCNSPNDIERFNAAQCHVVGCAAA